MKKFKYEGGIPQLDVILTGRVLNVSVGDEVEVTEDQAKELTTVPGFKPVRQPKPAKEGND